MNAKEKKEFAIFLEELVGFKNAVKIQMYLERQSYNPSQLLERKEQIEEVYSMDECVFEYCPNPDHCKFETKCQNPL